MGLSTRPRMAYATAITVLALVATACGGGSELPKADPGGLSIPSASAAPEETGIAIDGLEPADVEVTETTGVSPGAGLSFVSPVYTVTSEVPLGGPTTVELMLTNAIPSTSLIHVVTRKGPGQRWSFTPGKLTEDPKYVEFSTARLGDFGVVLMDPSAASQAFKAEVRRLLKTTPTTAAEQPTCQDPEGAVEDGYSVRATETANPSLAWCLGLDGEKRVLKVLNNLASPVQVVHPDAPELDVQAPRKAWVPWAGALGTEYTFLAPGADASYDVDLEPLTNVVVTAGRDPQLRSLKVLQAAVKSIAATLRSFGTGPADARKAFDALVARPQCQKALGTDAMTLMQGCLTQRKLVQTFGSRALLLKPVLPVKPTAAFLQRHYEAQTKDATKNVVHRIVVARAKPDFSVFVGTWTGRTRSLLINDEGVVLESVSNAEGQAVIDVTYRLSNPDTEGGVSTAETVITKVKLRKRKDFSGRVPKVGDTGTLRLRKGVIRSPAIKANYCDVRTGKKGGCGL